MEQHLFSRRLIACVLLVLSGCLLHSPTVQAGTGRPIPKAVLVELFTSEGCSSCPPADELLRQISGQQTDTGQFIIGLSEHVTYWNSLGWKDPFSSEVFTERQNEYGTHFGLESVYTPQMIVNGREQFVGSDRHALQAALAVEAQREQVKLHITGLQTTSSVVTFSYSASAVPDNKSVQLIAVFVDDMDSSKVLRGENSGRQLRHISVARAFAPLGPLHEVRDQGVSLPLPPVLAGTLGTGHHFVLFAQERGSGAVIGVDTVPL